VREGHLQSGDVKVEGCHSGGNTHPLAQGGQTRLSARGEPQIGGLVVGSVTTCEYPLLYVLLFVSVFDTVVDQLCDDSVHAMIR